MSKLQDFMRLSLIPMMFILPLWLTVGRMAFGVAGYVMIGDILFIAPSLFISLFIIGALITLRSDVKKSGKVSRIDVVMLSILYIAVLLYGFFAIDGGDTKESVISVASILFGRSILNLSRVLDSVFYWISLLISLAYIVIALIELLNIRNINYKKR